MTIALAAFKSRWNDTVIVRVGQCVGGLDAVSHGLVDREDGLSESIAQGPSVNELHRDERLAVRFADLVYRADVRVIQRGRIASLAQQSGAGGPVAGW